MTGRALVVQADALRLPLPDGCVDLVVTSPPYFALRAYATGGHPAEVGSEAHWRDWLARLVDATAEVARVLKPSGSIFCNLGDKYAAAQGGRQSAIGELPKKVVHREAVQRPRDDLPNPPASWGTRDATPTYVFPDQPPPKSLMLLPERYRIACVDQLGLTARAVIVWDKPNGLPESVTDRVRRSHEDWVHLTKQPRYFSALDELREPYSPASVDRYGYDFLAGPEGGTNGKSNGPLRSARQGTTTNPLGKLPGSVWSIPSEPLRLPAWLGVDHYAAFPSEWPRRLVLGWSPPGICCVCGEGRVPVVDRRYVEAPRHGYADTSIVGNRNGGPDERRWDGAPRLDTQATILGYACSCCPSTLHPGTGDPDRSAAHRGTLDAGRSQAPRGNGMERVGPWREWHIQDWQPPPTRPAIVLDPFGGVGTTAGVARRLGRIGLSFDLSFPYSRAAAWRIFDSGQFGKAEARTWRDRQGALPL